MKKLGFIYGILQRFLNKELAETQALDLISVVFEKNNGVKNEKA